VADPGFDLRVAWTLSTGGGGGGRKTLNVFIVVEVKVIFSRFFLAIFLLKLCLKQIASEASEENFEKK